MVVKRILITGMSATGKSTLVRELRGRGFDAVDLDEPGWSEYGRLDDVAGRAAGDASDPEWLWAEERVEQLLATEDTDLLFVSGCARNQGKFYRHFDHVVLLTAPVDVTIRRLATRTTNEFGKSPDEVAKVLADKGRFEPMLRDGADLEIDSSAPLEAVLEQLLGLARD